MEPKIEVIHEPAQAEPFVVIKKPKNLPSAPLADGDPSAYSQCENLFPELKNVSGKKTVEHGLVHRIDTETDGLLLIAATQDFYDWIQNVQSSGGFLKQYTAICHVDSDKNDGSFPEPPFWGPPKSVPAKIESLFRFFGPKNSFVRPVTDGSSKIVRKKASGTLYTTSLDSFEKVGCGVKVRCSIERGFKHQVRCHLAWCGLSVFGDKKYSRSDDGCELKFSASALTFPLENGRTFHIDI